MAPSGDELRTPSGDQSTPLSDGGLSTPSGEDVDNTERRRVGCAER
jgi:hypothetical protein